jgi:IS5 family transposase
MIASSASISLMFNPLSGGRPEPMWSLDPKLAISSLVDGYALVEKMSWNNDNEPLTLQESVERYRESYGHYPEVVLAVQIAGTVKIGKTTWKKGSA